jgi:lysophospholipid acyltransferase (LPLAT)-like uncharacterized protein
LTSIWRAKIGPVEDHLEQFAANFRGKKMTKRILVWFASWCIAGYVLLLRLTCRHTFENDPRPELRETGQNYLFSMLHSNQLAIVTHGEPGTGAMVSKSADGQLIVPALIVSKCTPVRGSKWRATGGKGGREAVEALTQHVLDGFPAAVAVDGPRGPRGRVHKGIAAISQATGAAVLNVVAVPTQRYVFKTTWDRLQLPLPFCLIRGYFAEPIFPIAGEKLEAYRHRIEVSLRTLEQRVDPTESCRQASEESEEIAEQIEPDSRYAA